MLTYEVPITSLLPLPSSTCIGLLTPRILSREFAFAPYDLLRVARKPPHLEMPGRLIPAPSWPVTDKGPQNSVPLPQGGAMVGDICTPEPAEDEALAGLYLGPQGSSAPSPAPSPENIPPTNHVHSNPCLSLCFSAA